MSGVTRSLTRLLNPKSIAVIGGKECERVIEQCDKLGFKGTIWPVHPTREDIGGRQCFRKIEDLPEAPDAAFVAVNRERTIDIVKSLSNLGAGGAVCYAAGFAEADGEDQGSEILQNQLVEAAGDMPLIGPNCYGFINLLERVALWPDQHGAVACERGVAIITQSSNVAINLTMQKRGLPIAQLVTAGNQAQTGLSELGIGLIEDERVSALGLHIEGLDDVKVFEKLALRARELGKPIIALKVGKSVQARAAAITHTASLAGSDIAHDALFKRLGIARVHSLETFIETLKLLHVQGSLSGTELLSLSCSGGEASLMADAAAGRNIHFRPFSKAQAKALKSELGDTVAIANPLDYNTFIWGDWSAMERMFCAALAPKFDLAMLIIDFPRTDRCDDSDWRSALECFIAAAKKTSTSIAILSSLSESMSEEMAENIMGQGITPLSGLDHAVQAVEAAAFIGEAWNNPPSAPLLGSRDGGEVEMLNEHQSKAELAAAGLNIPHGILVTPSTKFSKISINPPFALKALGIAHKTEAGAVVLNLQSADEAEKALSTIAHLSDQFLLEEMAGKPIAELIVGVTRDPVCGFLLTIGAGGVLSELLTDSVSLLLPASENEIRLALGCLKIANLLEGYRGTEAADMDALIANILCIANYAVENSDTLEELDVNPLFAMQFGSVATDALIVKML